jgi:hypothetical protein
MYTLEIKKGLAKLYDSEGNLLTWDNYAEQAKRIGCKIASRDTVVSAYKQWLRVNIGEHAPALLTVN